MDFSVVCTDDPEQLIETFRKEAMQPGKEKCDDYENIRHGVTIFQ
jgi:hypothetical protein